MREAQIYIEKQRKTEKNTESGGVVSQLGESLPLRGRVGCKYITTHIMDAERQQCFYSFHGTVIHTVACNSCGTPQEGYPLIYNIHAGK